MLGQVLNLDGVVARSNFRIRLLVLLRVPSFIPEFPLFVVLFLDWTLYRPRDLLVSSLFRFEPVCWDFPPLWLALARVGALSPLDGGSSARMAPYSTHRSPQQWQRYNIYWYLGMRYLTQQLFARYATTKKYKKSLRKLWKIRQPKICRVRKTWMFQDLS